MSRPVPSPTPMPRRSRRARRGATALALALAAGATLPPVAGAAPSVGAVLDLPAPPRHLTTTPDGDVWIALGGTNPDLARVHDGVVTGFALAAASFPSGITTGPDGRLWLTQSGGVVRVDPAAPASGTAFAIPGLDDPRRIVTGPDGNLWTASGDRVFRIPPGDPAGRATFTVAGMSATSIAAGGDGHLWITDFAGQRVVRMATDGTFTTTALGESPQDVAAGPDGQVAITGPTSSPHRIWRVTAGGQPDATLVPASDVFGIAYGGDGAYWSARFATASLARLTPSGEVSELTGLPTGSGPRYLVAAGGRLWVGLEQSEQVAEIRDVAPPVPADEPPVVGGDPPPVVDRAAPRVSDTTVLRRRFRAGRVLRPARGGRSGVGTALRLTLGEAATVAVTVEQRRAGRRAGGTCRPPRRTRSGRACSRWVPVQELRRTAAAGRVSIHLDGRRRGRALPAGAYRLRVLAIDAAGNRSPVRTRAIRIVRR
ncbi:hypothetical protein SK069_12475 [Patulibacter brassicae]|uniref:SMP-30/Gluconolactonase/LRE-like region domain-containing protein n=1 Tax=Patulibacter brassicae TaxID=1705717 RepID=A0ABU4VLT2_9ACTN|nr:hypothetical protein [Patulibacter brassicae]MDX8152415.1 hypothetical protein [Patulibacter brassicae]